MTRPQKTITIFGGTGFLGRHIVTALAKTGARIRVATRNPARAYFLKPAGDPGQITAVRCDVHDTVSVASALKGATDAVNLIGILFEKGTRQKFDALHRDVPHRIAQQSAEQGLSMLVHISALGAAPTAASRYAQTKAAGEDGLIRAMPRSVILRPSVVFGPEDDFFNRFATMARMAPVLPLVMGGTTKFQPVYVGDIAQAVKNLMSCTDSRKYLGHTYEIGGPAVYTFRELLEMMMQVTGKTRGFVSLPAPAAKIIGALSSCLPRPALTVDQVRSLTQDNVLSGNYPGLAELGVTPTPLQAILPTYLAQYRQNS